MVSAVAPTNRAFRAWTAVALSIVLGGWMSMQSGHADTSDPGLAAIVFELRAWRLATAMLAGAALAIAGVLVQGLFRNPLASPSILGTTAGASLGGVLALMAWNFWLVDRLPGWLPAEMVLPAGCMLGALAALLVLLAVTGGDASIVAVLLTGFILTSFFLSLIGLLSSIAQENWEIGRAIVAFTLGSVDAKGQRHVALALPMVAMGFAAAMMWSNHLDLMLSGEDEATTLGVDVALVRRWAIVWTAVLTAAAVALCGGISFVGLIVPHALRTYVGSEHRRLMPICAVGGAAFVVWADIGVRWLPTQGQVPLGVVTGLVGAPVFLLLLMRAHREGRLA